jgi:hypothetical protein
MGENSPNLVTLLRTDNQLNWNVGRQRWFFQQFECKIHSLARAWKSVAWVDSKVKSVGIRRPSLSLQRNTKVVTVETDAKNFFCIINASTMRSSLGT